MTSFQKMMTAAGLLSSSLLSATASAQFVNQNPYGPPVQWHVVQMAQQTRFTGDSTWLIYTPGQFEQFWQRAYGPGSHAPSSVNFNTEMVIAVNGGAGQAAMIQRIDRTSPTQVTIVWAPTNNSSYSGGMEVIALPRPATNFAFSQQDPIQGGFGGNGNVTILPGGIRVSGSYQPPIYYGPCPWAIYSTGYFNDCPNSYYGIISNYGMWSNYCGTVLGPDAYVPQDINWNTEQIAVINVGAIAQPGFSVGISGIVQQGPGEYQIQYYLRKNPTQQVTNDSKLPQRPASPFALIRLPKVNANFTFKKVEPVNKDRVAQPNPDDSKPKSPAEEEHGG